MFILGILKAVHGAQACLHNRVTKDVVAFYAGDFPDLVEKLQLDLHEPPISQVVFLSLLSFHRACLLISLILPTHAPYIYKNTLQTH